VTLFAFNPLPPDFHHPLHKMPTALHQNHAPCGFGLGFDTLLACDVKTNLRLGPVSENREQMIEKAMSFMPRLSSWPERVRAYFQHPSAKYAAQPI